METKHYQKGETVFQELSYGNTMYEIKSGRVGVYLSYGKPDETKLTELEAGRIFGEMSVIEAYPRSATVVALEDVEALEVSAADIREYFGDRPDKLLEIIRSLSRRLRELTADYDEACAALGEWKSAEQQNAPKRSGLADKLAKFAKAYTDRIRGAYPGA